MCGIFGYDIKPGLLSEGQLAILGSTLIRQNDKRGGHSWGFAGIRGKQYSEPVVIKRGMGAFYTNSFNILGFDRMFGHSRWATHGAKTVENSHPFEIGNIIGAHNGVISNHQALCTKYDRKFEVDSMHLFAHLDQNRSFDEIEGYGAIEWMEKTDPSKIYLCKMAGGDLAVAAITEKDSKNRIGIIWSSDKKHLESAIQSAGVLNTVNLDIDEGKIYSIRDNQAFIEDDKLEIKRVSRTHTSTNLIVASHWNYDGEYGIYTRRHNYNDSAWHKPKTEPSKPKPPYTPPNPVSQVNSPSDKLWSVNIDNLIFCETCGFIESEHDRPSLKCDKFIPEAKEIKIPFLM